MTRLSGACHCGNIILRLELSRAPGAYKPRACDCSFCTKHGAAYISDPQGSLHIQIANERASRIYRQGSGAAECLLCANCGVLVGVLYRDAAQVYAAVNVKAVDALPEGFGVEQAVSPKDLPGSDRITRWKSIWFPTVTLAYAPGQAL
jgi:hypothetical protein